MINKLDNANKEVARKIYRVFQNAYQVEAQLIGTDSFPPLNRGVNDIVQSNTVFFGFSDGNSLAGVIETEFNAGHLDIHSLTVDPGYFRNGIAGKLISFVLTSFEITQATVETAVVNAPAIQLYQKHGFVKVKTFTPTHGIEKIALQYTVNSQSEAE
ncbi:MAG: GNAT family N-acetyltransferase [Aestuariibacter sp.]